MANRRLGFLASSSRSDGVSEKKATSVPDIRAENINRTNKVTTPKNCGIPAKSKLGGSGSNESELVRLKMADRHLPFLLEQPELQGCLCWQPAVFGPVLVAASHFPPSGSER